MKSCDCHAAINWCHCLSADRTMTKRCAAVVGHAPRQRFHQQGSTNPCSDWNCHLLVIHFVHVPFLSFVLVSFFVLISVHRKKSKFTRLRNSSDFIHLQRIYFTFCSLLFLSKRSDFPFLWKGNQSNITKNMKSDQANFHSIIIKRAKKMFNVTKGIYERHR